MREPILQSSLPFLPWMDPMLSRLPGLVPLRDVMSGDRSVYSSECRTSARSGDSPDAGSWLVRDEAFAGQMTERDRLLRDHREAALQVMPDGEALAAELLTAVLEDVHTRPGYRLADGKAIRPDGVEVALDDDHPLAVAGRLVQEDFALLASDGGTHRLVGGVLCFPAHWSLAEKLGRSMAGVHGPVPAIDEGMDRRIERLFCGLQPARPVMRANVLIYTDPALHQPHREHERKTIVAGAPRYVRMERQCLMRLPRTGGVVFSIHTYVVRAESVPAEALARLVELRPELAPDAARP